MQLTAAVKLKTYQYVSNNLGEFHTKLSNVVANFLWCFQFCSLWFLNCGEVWACGLTKLCGPVVIYKTPTMVKFQWTKLLTVSQPKNCSKIIVSFWSLHDHSHRHIMPLVFHTTKGRLEFICRLLVDSNVKN